MTDTVKLLRTLWPPLQSALRTALHEAPNSRQHVKQAANKLQALQQDDVPADIRTWAQDAERWLRDQLKRTAPPARADDSGPTPETREKAKQRQRKKDTIDRLYETGALDSDDVDAAEEIREIYECVTRGLNARARDYRDVKVQTSMGRPRDPIDGVPGHIDRQHARVYAPWCEEMRHLPAAKDGSSARGSLYDLAMDVLIEGKAVRTIERDYGVRNGQGAQRLATALERYAKMARHPPDTKRATGQHTAPCTAGTG